jgi:hypothetical protein
MTNPTSNFGWQMPTNTDLVTDLPADFAVFGQAVDTSMADLLGGASGYILSKASATNMDFTWIANDQGDITGVTAGTGITVTSPTGPVPTVSIDTAVTVDKTTTQTLTNKTLTSPALTTPTISTATTNGDLLYGTGSGALTRLGIGSTSQVLTVAGGVPSWATASSGSSNVAGKNSVINSNFSVWQRGTTFAVNAAAYTADRWQALRGVAGLTVSRQTTSDTTNLAFIQYCARVQRDLANASTATNYLANSFESVNSIPFAGKTVTLSFYARAGANYSGTLSAQLFSGTGTDQNILSTYTGSVTVINQQPTLTTTWQRFSYSASVGATATELAQRFEWAPTGVAGVNDYFEVTGVQVEISASATAYSPNGATQALELAACQRYYFRYDPSATGTTIAFSRFGFGAANTTGAARVQIQNPTTMRIGPSTLDYNTNIVLFDGVTTYAQSSIVIDTSSPLQTTLFFTPTVASLTAFRPYWLYPNGNTAAFVGLSSEL